MDKFSLYIFHFIEIKTAVKINVVQLQPGVNLVNVVLKITRANKI